MEELKVSLSMPLPRCTAGQIAVASPLTVCKLLAFLYNAAWTDFLILLLVAFYLYQIVRGRQRYTSGCVL